MKQNKLFGRILKTKLYFGTPLKNTKGFKYINFWYRIWINTNYVEAPMG
jgi:hypothetical protein